MAEKRRWEITVEALKGKGDRYIAVDFETRPGFSAVAEASGCHGEAVHRAW